jgi:dCMP deaminase
MRDDFYGQRRARWDKYFHDICIAISTKSPCLSRQIGAILVRNDSIVSTGFNGPPRGFPHCKDICPRKAKGYKSGEGLVECPATHAEANCIANAARIGACTVGTTLYMNCIIPCKDCMSILINAGIDEIVVDDLIPYHELSLKMAQAANIKLRRFML